MADQPFAKIDAIDPFVVAQSSESKWQTELQNDALKTGAAKPIESSTKPGESAAKTILENSTKPEDTAQKKPTTEAGSQPQELTPTEKKLIENQRISSGVITPTLAGGLSASLLANRTIEATSHLAFNAQRIKSTNPLAMLVRDAGKAWVTDATASKLIVSRADMMAGVKAPTFPSISSNLKRGALNTLGIGLILEADRISRDPEEPTWNINSLTVPLGMILGRGAGQKALFAGVGLATSNLLDRVAPPPMPPHSALNTFTSLDATAMGIAFAIPTKSYAVKTGIVGVAWAAGNALETASRFAEGRDQNKFGE